MSDLSDLDAISASRLPTRKTPEISGHLRVLLINQDVIGSTVLGHRQTELMLRTALEEQPGIEATFARLPPKRNFERLLGARIPLLWSRDLDLHVLRWHLAECLRGRRVLHSEIASASPDVVHLHSHALGFAAGKYLCSVPVVLSVDAPVRAWEKMGIWRPVRRHTDFALTPAIWLERRAVRQARKVLAWSPWAARELARDVPDVTIEIHHPGIDTHRYCPAPREEHGRVRILFVGSRFPQKGGFELLETLDPYIGNKVEIDLVTPYDLPPRDGVRVHRLDAASPSLVRLFQQADVFCLPTHGDASPWAVLEALACGTPVVATDVGGIPDQVRDRETGLVVPASDRRALHECLLRLIDDEALRRTLGAHARADVEARFDVRRQAVELIRHLDDAARGARC